MRGKKTKRAVVILHPDFDVAGKQGIAEAKKFAEQFIKGQRDMAKIASESESADVVNRIRAYTGKLIVVVRNIPEDLI